jgi:hypothetical protein
MITWLWANLKARIPLGYEGATGFRLGIETIALPTEPGGLSKPNDEDANT